MRQHLVIIAILISLGCVAQKKNLPGIEDLKKELRTLKKTKFVDKANSISETYGIIGQPKFLARADSINLYAGLALSEAIKNNYKSGMAYAYLNLAAAEKIRMTGLQIAAQDVLPAAEKMLDFLVQAFQLSSELKDADLLIACYTLAGSYPWMDSKLPPAKLKLLNDHVGRINEDKLLQSTKNEKKLAEIYTYKSEGFAMNGNYEKAFDYGQKAIPLNQKILSLCKTKEELSYRVWLLQQSLTDMANLYKEAADFHTALEYFNRSEEYSKIYKTKWYMESEKAEIFIRLGKYDSAFLLLNKVRQQSPDNAWTKLSLGQGFSAINETDSAFYFLQDALAYFKKINNDYFIAPVMLELSSLYVARKDYKNALAFASQTVSAAEGLNDKPRPLLLKGYELLSKIHHGLGANDSAYFYLLKYNALKDSIQNRQFFFRISAAKKEATIGLLDRDNKLKKSELKQQTFIKNSLAAGLILFIVLGFFIFRNQSLKRRNERFRLQKELELQQKDNEKRQTEFQRQAVELEMQALRAQMNPHFIFNCLSSINRFIFKNDNQAASDYLTKFSRLIRMVLIHSQKRFVPLEDELEMLRLYLDMERLRFKYEFDYSITTNNTIDAGAIFIPPLLLQPFCENAIWHGLMHKEGRGQLSISITDENGTLHCSIVDDGVGRERAAQFRSKSAEKEKSLGLKITTARLALLNGEANNETFYKIDDVLDEAGNVSGTRVDLKIKYKATIEEREHA